MKDFNRVLVRFRDEFERAEMRAQVDALRNVSQRMSSVGCPARLDQGRDWENAHVLCALGERFSQGKGIRLLDIGGGGSPLACLLAERGFQVTVLDIDRGVVELVTRTASALGLANLSAVRGGAGTWDLDSESFDGVLSISVIEGILRSQRPAHWTQLRRVLKAEGSLLLTFDFGPGARFLGDAPHDASEVRRMLIEPSQLELVGLPLEDPHYDPTVGPPVKALVPTVDGHDTIVAAYSFGALHLRKPKAPSRLVSP